MKTSIIGFPRIGFHRELKFETEKYFKGQISQTQLLQTARTLRLDHLKLQAQSGLNYIPSNDFSLYDGMLDTAIALGAVPSRYRSLHLDPVATCFAMARGYQGPNGDVKALAMKKWFNTNYHYMVPELDDDTVLQLNASKILTEFQEAKQSGIITKPVVTGPFTFLKLAEYTGRKTAEDFCDSISPAYRDLIHALSDAGAEWIQFDEPFLVHDLDSSDFALFHNLYQTLLSDKASARILLQTYFGDLRDCYPDLLQMNFDGIGIDFTEGVQSLSLIRKYGFSKDKTLFAGVINGKNIWRNDYRGTLTLLAELKQYAPDIVLNTSCSLLHVPYTTAGENGIAPEKLRHLAFACEKLTELADLKRLTETARPEDDCLYTSNRKLFAHRHECRNENVQSAVAALRPSDFIREPAFAQREKIQKEALHLPLFPTTTIGSFPQTADVRKNRADYRHGRTDRAAYDTFNREKIKECIALQEKIGLDVLVHGEYERNDMVEYFGENLDGFLFTENAWVQSYGTRCVKPPIIWGDVSRKAPITVDTAVYAQSLSKKPVKGMLTGPVTILNWSFPREDITGKESILQIALAIRAEVLDLEAHGIRIIQIDEAALREKLPLRKSDWHSEYLDFAIPAFRLVHSGVKPKTQIHTHMCYSEFGDIIREIDDMDADVITFEASRSNLSILSDLKAASFRTEVGPGVYDIHSPRIPSCEEITSALKKMLEYVPAEKLWVNPDCGLKTRAEKETVPSLTNLVAAARSLRSSLS